MSDTVAQRGLDADGRPVFMTNYMWWWWLGVKAQFGFDVTIVQGAWMVRAGGGAVGSAGYHDGGGCLDLRTWDKTKDQIDHMVRVLRRNGAAAWRRDGAHGGFDPHLHFVLGTDHGLAPGAAEQWDDYQRARDGLKSLGSDYEWRPSPLVLTPPKEVFDVPYTDWPKADQEALVRDLKEALAPAVAEEVWDTPLPAPDPKKAGWAAREYPGRLFNHEK